MIELTSLLSTVGIFALMMTTGFIGGKTKVLGESVTEKLSVFVIKIVQPFLIVNSFLGLEFSVDNFKTGLLILLIGICMHAGMAAIAFLLAKPIKPMDERKLSEYSMVFANIGFIGFPILEAIFGKIGLFYGAFYLVSFHLFLWTWGIAILARNRKDIKITPRKIFINNGTVPIAIGLVLFLINIKYPAFITSFTSAIADIGTPVSIMITGANLARRSFKKMFTNWHVYYVCAMRLIAMPLAAIVIVKLLGLPEYLVIFSGVMAAMPCPAVVTMFGEMYKISPGYASELVGSSTLLSIATIIPVATFAQFVASL